MSVLDRDALEASPLADLHEIASALQMERYRRLRKSDLIDAIIARQGGEEASEADAGSGAGAQEPEAAEERSGRRRRGKRGGRKRTGEKDGADQADKPAEAQKPEKADKPEREERQKKADKPEKADKPVKADKPQKDEHVEGVVELLPNGSGFIRLSPPEPSDEDVYISAAQAKRCELVSGDVVGGPRRPPARSERFASLFRIETINGKPASDIADRGRFDDLPATFATDRFALGSEDPTVAAIELLTPFGRGSRVLITGGPWAGKSETLRRLGAALAATKGATLLIALAGVRPEELPEWAAADGLPAASAALSFGASSDARDNAVEAVIEQARRIAARGEDAVVLLDTLDGLHEHTARRALATARKLADGGSVTVIATSSLPLGGETTLIALDRQLTAAGRFPALDLTMSGTLRAELLVGPDGARAITDARAQALAGS